MDETKLVARLPLLDIEIVRRDLPEEGCETISIHMRATPSFSEAGRFLLEPYFAALPAPFAFWMGMANAAWQPWISMASRFLLPWSPAKDE